MNTELKKILEEADLLKARLQAIRPLDTEALRKIKAAFEMEYTYESNRIEGNTLTLQETALVVSEGVTIGGKSIMEHLEAINHAQAVEFIKEIASNDIEITERTIQEIHALVLHGINRQQAGKYRSVPVMIVGSRHTPPQPYLIEPQMEKFIIDYKTMEEAATHTILIAAYLHDELVKIHPFIDGNGRTSRLLMNLYLLSKGYIITSLKANNEAKQAYYTALEQSHTDGNRAAFNLIVANAVKNALENYLGIVEAANNQ
ncbi:MAG: Fic family protein [Dysgonamonadaceae bacterium]|jgi:Fic family protein|nr:Fic family protein [Dysgonamonadaceae bacterium]